MAEDLKILERLLGRHPKKDNLARSPGGGLPAVAPPPLFRPTTPFVGRPAEARELESLFRIAPELRGRVPRVIMGPTASIAALFSLVDKGPEFYEQSRLHGATGRDNTISINPDIGSGSSTERLRPSLRQVLGHELGHVAGYSDDDPEIKEIERSLGLNHETVSLQTGKRYK